MSRIISIDPGTRLSGYALFVNGACTDASVIASRKGSRANNTVAGRAHDMARQLRERVGLVDVAVVERPVIYPDSRERDSDIVNLAVTAGILAGAFDCELDMPTPREWKGTVPKDIHNSRTRAACPAAARIISQIRGGVRNHAWDAVGLGLWYLGKG